MHHIFDRVFFGYTRWRHVKMDELSELYISMMLRHLAMSLIGIFIPIFLYLNSYSIRSIFLFYSIYFASRIFADFASAHLVGSIGPKHSLLVSYLIQIVSTVFFLTLPSNNWPLFIPAILWGISSSIYFVAFHVDFSKVKHVDTEGSEMGKLSIAERFGGAIGPAAGGAIAYLFGAEYIFILAIVILLAGLIPLFNSGEPTRLNQKITFKTVPFGKIYRDHISYLGVLVEYSLSVVLFPLFLAVYVLGDSPYLKMGAIASLGVLISMVSAYAIGKIVDNKKGGMLLRISSVGVGISHLAKPFVSSLGAAALVNMATESFSAGIKIPYQKGVYDRADSLPGGRIAYLASLEIFGSIVKFSVWLALFILTGSHSAQTVFTIGFIIAGAAPLLLMVQNFPTLKVIK